MPEYKNCSILLGWWHAVLEAVGQRVQQLFKKEKRAEFIAKQLAATKHKLYRTKQAR